MEPMTVLEVRDCTVADTLGATDQQQVRVDPAELPWANSENENAWRMSGAFCLASQR